MSLRSIAMLYSRRTPGRGADSACKGSRSKGLAATAVVLGTLLLAVACGDEPATPTAPSRAGPSTQPPLPGDAEPFEVTGVVTNDQGVPVAGAVVTMASYLGGVVQWPLVVADASGAYRIGFSATVQPRPPGGRFVARAEVMAAGYELCWRNLIAPVGLNTVALNFQVYSIRHVAAEGSTVAAFPSEVGDCPGWVAERCGIVRVAVPRAGRLTVAVTSADQSAEQPPLEICCVSGTEFTATR